MVTVMSASLRCAAASSLRTQLGCLRISNATLLREHPEGFKSIRCMSSDGDSKSEDKPGPSEANKEGKKKPSPKERSDAAKTKLNDLLTSIVEGGGAKKEATKPAEKVNLAVPQKPKLEKRKPRVEAAAEAQGIKLGKRVLAAVKKVAAQMDGDPEVIESELVQKLKSQKEAKVNISDLFDGMKVESTGQKPERQARGQEGDRKDFEDLETSRAARVRTAMRDYPSRRFQQSSQRGDGQEGRDRRSGFSRGDAPTYVKYDLFGGQPLGIFKVQPEVSEDKSEDTCELKTWDRIYKKELKVAVTHPPANGFEEMILWTEQEKLWKFPINNEQGMDDEAQYSFVDHVFLENYIESWCPDEGPIRNFMELVCVGLSKNSYLSVPEKHEYLDWYHEYFAKKSAILKQTGMAELKC